MWEVEQKAVVLRHSHIRKSCVVEGHVVVEKIYVRHFFTGDLCVDSRPAVRKSAGQTLFSTIAAHGALLHNQTWQAVLWQVRFSDAEENFSVMDCIIQSIDFFFSPLLQAQRSLDQKIE